ncbi:hypothetical protein TWF696_000100 [Orbilia brochopaga]|uniref:Superoxide dismutase copper/zinc binding domain-containing protein n=1 Tax=Orbilia brochopaga TaxID=3140254 RepID=A0AAV9VDD1_9PEZI
MHLSTSTVLAVAVTAATTATAQVTGAKGNAPVTTGNSDTILYETSFSSSNVESGYLNFTGTSDGVGVLVTACFKGINASQPGPYPYHIHDFVVGPNENCTATGGHLDPYMRMDLPACDSAAPETCQVGDLSGKHGKVPVGVDDYCTSYVDNYLSLDPSNVGFIGNSRSIVIHNVNLTRIGCGNIVQGSTGGMYPTNTTTPGGNNVTTYPTPTVAPPIASGGATSLRASMALGVILAVGSLVL